MKTFFYGSPFDYLARLWSYWWIRYSFFNGLQADNISFIAYPYGIKSIPIFSLWTYTTKFSSIILGDVLTLNIQILLCFFLTGLVMYLFVLYLTKSKHAAIFSGVLLSLSPYHFARSWDHLGLANMQWLVGYIFALFYLHKSGKKMAAVLCGVAFGLIGQFSNYYYVYFAFLFSMVYLFYRIWYEAVIVKSFSMREWRKLFINVLIVVFVTVLMLAVQLGPMFLNKDSNSQSSGFIRTLGQLFADSATPLNYVLPAVYNPILGKITEPWIGTIFYGENSGAEQTLFLGFLPMIIAFLGWKKWKKNPQVFKKYKDDDYNLGFFSLAFFIFVIASFSPYWGSTQGFFLPFPSFFLFKVLPMFRNYARMASLVLICLCVLSGYGLREILFNKSNKKKHLITGAFCFVLCIEFLNSPPFHVTNTCDIPDVYSWLKGQKQENIVLAEYPLEVDIRQYMFYQRVHEKPIVNGASPGTYAWEVAQKIKDIEIVSTAEILKYLGTTHVIIHKEKYRTGQGGAVLGRIPQLTQNSGLSFLKSFGDDDIYSVVAKALDPKDVEIKKVRSLYESTLSIEHPVVAKQWKFVEDKTNKYRIKYMGIFPVIDLNIAIHYENELKLAQINVEAKSIGLLNCLVKMKATVKSIVDTLSLSTNEYLEEYSVGDGKKHTRHAFYEQTKHIMNTDDRQVVIFPQTQDSISLLFFISHQELLPGKEFSIYLNLGKTNYKMVCKVKEKKLVKINDKQIACWQVAADFISLKRGSKKIGEIFLWLEDSQLNEVLRLKVSTSFGVITCEKTF